MMNRNSLIAIILLFVISVCRSDLTTRHLFSFAV